MAGTGSGVHAPEGDAMSARRPETAEEQNLMVLRGVTGALESIETQLGLLQQQLRGALGTGDTLPMHLLVALREHTRTLIMLLDDITIFGSRQAPPPEGTP
jgi:hypothetical protein